MIGWMPLGASIYENSTLQYVFQVVLLLISLVLVARVGT